MCTIPAAPHRRQGLEAWHWQAAWHAPAPAALQAFTPPPPLIHWTLAQRIHTWLPVFVEQGPEVGQQHDGPRILNFEKRPRTLLAALHAHQKKRVKRAQETCTCTPE
jgi:hypothetical protein